MTDEAGHPADHKGITALMYQLLVTKTVGHVVMHQLRVHVMHALMYQLLVTKAVRHVKTKTVMHQLLVTKTVMHALMLNCASVRQAAGGQYFGREVGDANSWTYGIIRNGPKPCTNIFVALGGSIDGCKILHGAWE